MVDMVKQGMEGFVPHLGGAPFNVAVGASRCGAKTAFCGTVGNDLWGDYIVKEVLSFGVDSRIAKVDRATTMAFVTIDKGERSFGFMRSDGADSYLDVEMINGLIKQGDIVHLGSLPLSCKVGQERIEEIIRRAKAKGSKLSFDVNLREGVWANETEMIDKTLQVVRACDYVKLNEEEWNRLCPEMERIVEEYPDKAVVVTLGEEGSMLYKDGYQSYVPADKVEAVDTTGAGDAFWGSMLADLDRWQGKYPPTHEDLIPMMENATRAGANAVKHFGAI